MRKIMIPIEPKTRTIDTPDELWGNLYLTEEEYTEVMYLIGLLLEKRQENKG